MGQSKRPPSKTRWDWRIGRLHVRSWPWESLQGQPRRETYFWAPAWTLHISWTRR